MYTVPQISALLTLASLVLNLVLPVYGLDNSANLVEDIGLSPEDKLATIQGQALIQSANPDMPIVVAQRWVAVTAYSSTVDQTDSTPFITASGSRVSDGIVACNFLRFGTRVRFPQLYGDKIFTVEDRMALKNGNKIDIWFDTRNQAKQFGVKTLKVEVLGT